MYSAVRTAVLASALEAGSKPTICGACGCSGRRLRRSLQVCAPLAASFDEAEAARAFSRPIRRRGGKLEVDEVGAATWRSGMARGDGAVAGEMARSSIIGISAPYFAASLARR